MAQVEHSRSAHPGQQRGPEVTKARPHDDPRAQAVATPAVVTAGPGATIRSVLELQRTAGNAAVRSLLDGEVRPSPIDVGSTGPNNKHRSPYPLQRGGPEALVESRIWYDLVGEFTAYVGEMAAVNVRCPNVTRTRWIDTVHKLWAQAGDPGARSDTDLLELEKAFNRVQDLFIDLNTEGFDLWFWLNDQYESEKAYLYASGWPDDLAAAEVLQDLYLRTYDRMEAAGPYLVPEDLAGFHQMLVNGTHLTKGAEIAERDARKRARLEEEFADESDEDAEMSAADIAWDVVGWDSWGEFAGDVALTVVSGGVGKVLRVVVKGRKAQKKLAKLKKLDALHKARKAKRAKKLKTGAADLARNVTEALKSGVGENATWLKKNWKKSAQAYLTDELGVVFSSGDPGEAKTLFERVSKDRIQAYVDEHVVPSKSDEEARFRAALFAAAAGMGGLSVRDLRRYFVMNLKRRGIGNTIYYAVRMGVLESPAKAGVAADLSASIAGDMLQDVLNQFGAGGVIAVWIESWRKALQNSVAAGVKEAFASE